MKLTFDLNKSAMTGKVQVQRTVNRNGTTFQQHFWVNPSDVKETDKVIGQTKGTESTVSPHKLGYYIDVASFKEKYAKALGIPTDRIKLGGRTRDSVDSNVVTFQIYDDSKHHGAHSTPQRGYDLGEIAIDTKNKTIQIRKPTFGDATSDTLGKAKKALDESKVNANQKQTNDTAKKDLDKKSDKSKSINPDKPVNIDDFKFTDYKNPDGQNTDKRKTYKSAMKDWSEQTEKLYERAMKNYWGDTPPEKQLHTAFMNLNREASIRDLVSNSSEAGLKEARDAIYARQNKLIEMSKKYTKWDSSKGKWIEGNSKDTSKDSTTDKAPDKAVGKNWSETKTELGKMGYKVDSIFSSTPPQPKEKLTLYKDGKTYEAELTKYHNGDYEVLGSSIKEVKTDTQDTKKDDSDKPKLTDPTTPTNPADIKVGDYIYYEDNEGAGGIKGVTQVREIKTVVIPKTGKTMYVFNEHGRHDRVSSLEGKTVKRYDTKAKQDTSTSDPSSLKVGTELQLGDWSYTKTGNNSWKTTYKGKKQDDRTDADIKRVFTGSDSKYLTKDKPDTSDKADTKTTSTSDGTSTSDKFDASEFAKLKSDRPKAIQYLKDNGISWKETDNEGINWMRACMAASRAENPAQGATKKDTASKPSTDSKPSGKSSEEAKKAVKDLLSANGNDRAKVMQIAKASGVTWNESDNDGINWMRASLAIQKHHESGKTINASDDKKQDNKTDDKPQSKKVTISDLKKPASNNTSTNLSVGDYKITVHKFRNVGANAKQHPSFYHIDVVDKDGENVFRTDKTDWSDIKYHAQRYIDAASKSDNKSDNKSDSKSSDSKPTKDKPLVTSDTKSGRPYQLWESNGKIYGSVPGQQDSRDARAVKDFTSAGFDSLDEVKDYIKKYF